MWKQKKPENHESFNAFLEALTKLSNRNQFNNIMCFLCGVFSKSKSIAEIANLSVCDNSSLVSTSIDVQVVDKKNGNTNIKTLNRALGHHVWPVRPVGAVT